MYLFDTMIISYMLRQDKLVELYRDELESQMPHFISAQTVGEIHYGAARRNWGSDRFEDLHKQMSRFSVLPIDQQTAEAYGQICAKAEKFGRRLKSQDAWILATANQYDLAVVSHDKDMMIGSQLGIEIISYQ